MNEIVRWNEPRSTVFLFGLVLFLSVLRQTTSWGAPPPKWEEHEGRQVLRLDGCELEASLSAEPAGFTLSTDGSTLVLSGEFPKEGEGPSAEIRIKHTIDSPKHIWLSHLAPHDEFVIGDHAFRSPTVLLADERGAVAVIPHLDDVGEGHSAELRSYLDYDHPNRTITLGVGNYSVDGHVFYKRAPLHYTGQKVRLRLHVLASSDPQYLYNPYALAAEFHWKRWGKPGHERGGSQSAPLKVYMDHIAKWAFTSERWGDTLWQSFEINGRPCGAPAFIVDVSQHHSVPMAERSWREQRSIWNQAWFSTQRCANGLYRYAKRMNDKDLERRARLSTALALSAPQKDGLFPAVYTTAQPGQRSGSYKDTADWDKARWTNSNRRPPDSSEDAIHIVDAAFTAQQLLEWYDLVGKDEETLQYVTRFADRLCRLQLPSGAFPGWVQPDGTTHPVLAEGPESAVSATLLLELFERMPDRSEYRETATKALSYLVKGPVNEGRWEDFETYFSCNNWGAGDLIGKRIERNGVYKQNTLSIFWCAEAFLAASRVLKDANYLKLGRRCLDELSLYQQVWDPPFIAASCHGGFGVMNTDGEWNDARQSLFAPLYLEYYKVTKHKEYLERGISALRSSFAMLYCPENPQVRKQYELKHPFFGPESFGFMMENIAHGGPAPADGSAIGPFTIFTWGNGAALASAAKMRDLYGDLFSFD